MTINVITNKNKAVLKSLFFTIFFLFATQANAALFISVISGDWDDGATWGNTLIGVQGIAGIDYPQSGDDVIVIGGTTISLDGDEEVNNLTIQLDGIVDGYTKNKKLEIYGSLILNGSFIAKNKSIIFKGGVGTSMSGIGTIEFINPNPNVAFIIEGNTSILVNSYITFFCNVEIDDNIIVTNYGEVSIGSDLIGNNSSSTWVNETASILDIVGELLISGVLIANANDNVVGYFGSIDQVIKQPQANTYFNIEFYRTGGKQQQGNLIILNDISNFTSNYHPNGYTTQITGNWVNDNGFYFQTISTVIFNGTTQNIICTASESFYNLEITNNTTVELVNSNVIVTNTFTMDGDIVTNSFNFIIGTSIASFGSLSYTSGAVIGNLERWLPATTGTDYLFPVGTAVNDNVATINFNAIGSGGSIVAYFTQSSPDNNGLPLVDGGTTIYNTFVDGYWSMVPANGLTSTDFNLTLDALGFTSFPITGTTRLLYRALTSTPWLAIGTHVAATGNVVRRSNLTSLSQFCLGDDTNCTAPVAPLITSAFTDVCQSTTGTYTVPNTGNTFNWTIQPVGSGTFSTVPLPTDNTVSVDWGTLGVKALIICEESNACTTSPLSSLNVTVNSIAPDEIIGDTTVAQGAIGEVYSVIGIPGYTYTWSTADGTVTFGQGTNSILVDWNATVGNVTLSVIAQSASCGPAPQTDLTVKLYAVINSNGTGGGDWHTASSWDCDCVPLPTENIRILPLDSIFQSNDVVINNVTLEYGATWERIENRDILVTGEFDNSGLVLINSGAKDIVMNGFGENISGTGLFVMLNGARFVLTNGFKNIAQNAVVTFTGGELNFSDAGLVLYNFGNMQVSDAITGVDATNKLVNEQNSVLQLGSTMFDVSGGELDATALGNTVRFGGNTQNMKNPLNNTFYHLYFVNEGTKYAQNSYIVNGDLLISDSSQFDINNFNINVRRNWVDTSIFVNPFVEGTSTVTLNGITTFNGINSQFIRSTNTEEFYNLTINNLSTGIFVDSSDVKISNLLTFTSGIINTRIYNKKVIIANGATVSGASNISYVAGLVEKIGNVPFVFPIGDNFIYAPSSISAPSLITDAFASEYYFDSPSNAGFSTSLKEATIDHLSLVEYWYVNRTSGISDVDVTLSWDTPRSGGVSLLTDLIVARWDGSQWSDHGNSATTGNITTGTVTTIAPVTSFSPFTLGSITSNNPLPIELIAFNAIIVDRTVDLSWTTASEINNDYFTIEKSIDGITWEFVLFETAFGNSTELQNYSNIDDRPYLGKSYYRLIQTDIDGTSTASKSVAINNNGPTNSSVLSPNPLSRGVNGKVLINGFNNQTVEVNIIDSRGSNVFSTSLELENESVLYPLNTQNLQAGVYQVALLSGSKKEVLKLIIR